MSSREDFHGPALFSYGFRPFFLAATLFALVVVPVWWLVWRGEVALGSHLSPTDWHVHEMIFGYGAAVVAGFLFTAIPNWTGRLPTRGWPLVALLTVWVAGRVAIAGGTGLAPMAVAAIDQAFLLAVAAMIARELVAGKNWRNLKVLVPVTLFWLANLVFHAEILWQGTADIGGRLGIALLLFLIMLIGGRIIPSFTRNWLAQRGATRLPVPFNRFDGACILSGALALLAWVAVPFEPVCAVLAAIAVVLNIARLARWQGQATWRSPLLLMLHLAFLMVSLGFAAVAATAMGLAAPSVGAHIFGIGAIGGMTIAVMMRATMGHTGRALVASHDLTLAFALLVAAAGARVAGGAMTIGRFDGIDASAWLWTGAFALIAIRIGPWLARPGIAPRSPGRNAGSDPESHARDMSFGRMRRRWAAIRKGAFGAP